MVNNCIVSILLAATLALGATVVRAAPLLTPGDAIIAFDFDLVSSSSYPVNEVPSKAIDRDISTKYLNFGQRSSGFIVTPNAWPRAVQSFVITTANDQSDRDPTQWALYGTSDSILSTDNSGGQAEHWTLVASGNIELPQDRRAVGPVVSFANATPYRSYRMVFPQVRYPSVANSMQLAEIQFFTSLDGTGAPVLAPGDPILAIDLPASESWSPVNEGAIQAIDGVTPTKYLNFGREHSGFIVTPSAGATVVSGFTMTSARDAEERDPVGWELYGTRDPIVSTDHSDGNSENWVPVANGTVSLPLTRLEAAAPVTFANLAAYTSYRFVVVSVRNPATANAMQFAEIQFDGSVGVPASPAIPPPNGPGNALNFDGVNDYVAAAPATLPAGNSPYTLEAWIKTTAMNSGTIAAWGSFGSNSHVNAFRLTPTGLVNYWWANDLFVTTPNLAGAWHHVAATFDGTTRRILVDGVVVSSDTPAGHNAAKRSFAIGSANGVEFFSGQMDEVRIWNVARSAAQIQADMRRQLFGNESGLVVYYRLDEATGVNAFDATGRPDNIAVLVNGPAWVASTILPFAPTVGTAPASAVTPTTATLNGSAKPNSAATRGYFEWGLTANYGDLTSTQFLGSGTAFVNWNLAVAGLTTGAAYHYRAVATNAQGSSFGPDFTFTPGIRTVTTTADSGPGSLRQALLDASAAGDTILFTPSLAGNTITLTTGELVIDKDLAIQGPGAGALTLSGNDASRIFRVASGRVLLSGLTMARGRNTGADGADGIDADGGPGNPGLGGAIFNFTGTLTLSNCALNANSTFGGRGGRGGISSFYYWSGGVGGAAQGGAVYNAAVLSAIDCVFRANTINGGAGGKGGAFQTDFGGWGGVGGLALGAGVYNAGIFSATNCTFYNDLAFGGIGGIGGDASQSAGRGGNGGNATGGALANFGTNTLVNCTLADNRAISGRGGDGGTGPGGPGGDGGEATAAGIRNVGPATFIHCTIADNLVQAADGGSSGDPGGAGFPGFAGYAGLGSATNRTFLLNTLLSRNRSFTFTQDVAGIVTSLGHNFVGINNGSVGWTSSDRVGSAAAPLDARMSFAGDYGGPGFTAAPFLSSPVLDAGDDAVLGSPYNLSTDSRGSLRRVGAHVDIGAFELTDFDRCSRGICGNIPLGTAGLPTTLAITLEQGWNTLGNNFDFGFNTLREVMPNAAEGAILYAWDSARRVFLAPNGFDLGEWSNPNQTLLRGQGVFIHSPARQTLTLRSSTGTAGVCFPCRQPAGSYLVASPLPKAASFEEFMGFPPEPGDRVFLYDTGVSQITLGDPPQPVASAHTYLESGWDVPPILPPGRAAWVILSALHLSIAKPDKVLLTATGGVGSNWRIDYRDAFNPGAPWQTLTTVTLTNGTAALEQVPVPGNRFYRGVRVFSP